MTDTPTPQMTPEQRAGIIIIASFDLPTPQLKRNIWQPVSEGGVKKMRLAPLDWQPSGAHHALEHLARSEATLTAERDAAQAEIARLTSERPYIVGWNHGFDEANYQHEHGCPSDGGIETKFVYTEADMAAALKKVTAT